MYCPQALINCCLKIQLHWAKHPTPSIDHSSASACHLYGRRLVPTQEKDSGVRHNQRQNQEPLQNRSKLSQPSLPPLNLTPTPVLPSGSQTSEHLYSESWPHHHRKHCLGFGECPVWFYLLSVPGNICNFYSIRCGLAFFYVTLIHLQIESSRYLYPFEFVNFLLLSYCWWQVGPGDTRTDQMAAPSNMTWGRMSRHTIKMKSNPGCRYTYHSVVWPGCQNGTCENIFQQYLLSFHIKCVLAPPGFETCHPQLQHHGSCGGKSRKRLHFLQPAFSELVLKIILWPSSKVIHEILTAEESPLDRRKEQRWRDIDRKVCDRNTKESFKWRLSPGNQGRLFVCGPWGRKVRKRVQSGRLCKALQNQYMK